MDMPEIRKVAGIFPPKYACYLISLFGLGSGGVGLAGIILYGLVEQSLLGDAVKDMDQGVKKIILLTVGLTSLLLVCSNGLLFLGVSFKSGGLVRVAKWVMFLMCIIVIIVAVTLPSVCFALEQFCYIKKINMAVTVLGYIALWIFDSIWIFFMVVAYNLEIQIG